MEPNNTLTFILIAAYLLPQYVGLFFLFKKAGEDSWRALVPFYNVIVMLRIVGRPWWWLLYMMIPLFGLFVAFGVYNDLVKSYGKYELKDAVLCALFPFIYVPYMGMSSDFRYEGAYAEDQGKTLFKEWTEAIGFAVIAATLIRWLIMEAYTIPTPSMESSLLVGDFLFVSKFHYGTRTTTTPLQVPLTHQKIWFTEIPSYLEWIKVPPYRLPGISEIKRNDVVVFNVPGIEQNNLEVRNPDDYIDFPIDLKTNYIKRCVAISGDTLQIIDRQVYINGKAQPNPEKMQLSYLIKSKLTINPRIFEKYEINEVTDLGNRDNAFQYLVKMRPSIVEELQSLPNILAVEPKVQNPYTLQLEKRTANSVDPGIFPPNKKWNGDFYGPLIIPKAGMTIPINEETIGTYGLTIEKYDHNKNAVVEKSRILIDGEPISEYTFKQDYYFMMGDNRHNSLDSRYWGFVPADHIVGKGFFIWLSLDNHGSFLDKIRWNRFFKMIE